MHELHAHLLGFSLPVVGRGVRPDSTCSPPHRLSPRTRSGAPPGTAVTALTGLGTLRRSRGGTAHRPPAGTPGAAPPLRPRSRPRARPAAPRGASANAAPARRDAPPHRPPPNPTPPGARPPREHIPGPVCPFAHQRSPSALRPRAPPGPQPPSPPPCKHPPAAPLKAPQRPPLPTNLRLPKSARIACACALLPARPRCAYVRAFIRLYERERAAGRGSAAGRERTVGGARAHGGRGAGAGQRCSPGRGPSPRLVPFRLVPPRLVPPRHAPGTPPRLRGRAPLQART